MHVLGAMPSQPPDEVPAPHEAAFLAVEGDEADVPTRADRTGDGQQRRDGAGVVAAPGVPGTAS
jgi:hypothetical protein